MVEFREATYRQLGEIRTTFTSDKRIKTITYNLNLSEPPPSPANFCLPLWWN